MLPQLSYTFGCMERVDRHGWEEGITILSHGTRVGVRVDTPGMLEQICEVFPPGWKVSKSHKARRLYSLMLGGTKSVAGVRRVHLLYMNASRLARAMDLDGLLPRLEADMQLYVAERAPRRVFVHAGVVAVNGKAILLPGRSLAGKTTLVAELLRAGATYYSDEYAVLDANGRVYPFPKSLSIRKGPTDPRPTRCAPDSLGATVGEKPLPVALVAMTSYRPGAHWRPRSLSNGKAILALLANTVPARRRPKATFEALQRVVADATLLTGARGESGEVARELLNRVA